MSAFLDRFPCIKQWTFVWFTWMEPSSCPNCRFFLEADGILEKLVGRFWRLVVLRIPFLDEVPETGGTGKAGVHLGLLANEQLDDRLAGWAKLDPPFLHGGPCG